jgi:hypothetical protein
LQSNISIYHSNTSNHCALDIGGVVYSSDGYLVVQNSSFSKSIANQGGVFGLLCSKTTICTYNILGNNFTQNTALDVGGAIYYNEFRPSNLLNNFYSSNQAVYGNNYGSYPYSVVISRYDKIVIASG